MKRCLRCKEEKELTEFYRDPRMRDGRKNYRKACWKVAYRANPVRKPVSEDRRRGVRPPRAWVARGPEISRYYRHKKRLLTPEQFAAALAMQGGVYAICRMPRKRNMDLCIDHNHETGQVRGLLCHKCNVALGYLGDSVERAQAAAHYLSSYLAQKISGPDNVLVLS